MYNKSSITINKKTLVLLSSLFLILTGGLITYATPPVSPYTIGQTLDPSCTPGAINCYVDIPMPSYTAGTGLTLTGSSFSLTPSSTNGQVLQTLGGVPTWVNPNTLAIVTADNGLTASGGNVQLGGTLTQNTTINQAGFDFAVMNGNLGYQNNTNIAGLGIPGTGSVYVDAQEQAFSGIGDGGSPFSRFPTMYYHFDDGTDSTTRYVTLGDTSLELRNTEVLLGDGVLSRLDLGGAELSLRQENSTTGVFAAIGINDTGIYNNAIRFSTEAGAYTFPRADGTANQVLTTNGSGTLSWQNAGGGSATATNGLSVIGSDIGLGGTLTQDTNIDQGGKLFSITDSYASYISGANPLGVSTNWIQKQMSPTQYTVVGLIDTSPFGGDSDTVMLGRVDTGGNPTTNIQIGPTNGFIQVNSTDNTFFNAGNSISLYANNGIEFSFPGGSYNFPTTDGTANQVLTTNGSSNLSWTTIPTPPVYEPDTVTLFTNVGSPASYDLPAASTLGGKRVRKTIMVGGDGTANINVVDGVSALFTLEGSTSTYTMKHQDMDSYNGVGDYSTVTLIGEPNGAGYAWRIESEQTPYYTVHAYNAQQYTTAQRDSTFFFQPGGGLGAGTIWNNPGTQIYNATLNQMQFWNGTDWLSMGGSNDAWSRTGNTGTDGGVTNFIGTTDAQDFVIRTNNSEAARFYSDSSSWISNSYFNNTAVALGGAEHLPGSNTNVLSFGTQAGFNIPNTIINALFLGESSGRNTTDTSFSTFIGRGTGTNALRASSSIFLGTGESDGTGEDAFDATQSIFIGSRAGFGAANAAHSIFIGRSAGASDNVDNTASGTSILIGEDTNTGGFSNSIALGASATNTSTNQFMIGSSSSPINTLILTGSGGNTCILDVTVASPSCSSDETLKTNVTDLTSTLDILSKVKTVTYNWKNYPTKGMQIGFLAQDLEQYFPEVVTLAPNGYKTVSYGGMTPILTKAIQELNIQLTTLPDTTTPNTFRDGLIRWLGDVGNGITELFAKTIRAKDQICIDDVCVNKEQLKTLLQSQNINTTTPTPVSDISDNQPTQTNTPPVEEVPPVVETPVVDTPVSDTPVVNQ